MASTTNMKFPDGRTEEAKVLTYFTRNGLTILGVETGKMDNGNKVSGISFYVNGMYESVPDEHWNDVKDCLVADLRDQITNEEYRIVPAEILVTENPYRPLALRDANYEKIKANYENFKNVVEQAEKQAEENVKITEVPVQEPVALDSIVNVEPQEKVADISNEVPAVEEIPTINPAMDAVQAPITLNQEPVIADLSTNGTVQEEKSADISNEVPTVGEIPTITPAMDTVQTPITLNQEPVIADLSANGTVQEEKSADISNEVPTVGEIPTIVPVMNAVQTPDVSTQTNENLVVNMQTNEGIADHLQNTTVSTGVMNELENSGSESIIPPEGIDISSLASTNENNVNMGSTINNNFVENSDFKDKVEVAEESPVTNTYLKSTKVIKEEMKNLTKEYTEKFQQLSEEFKERFTSEYTKRFQQLSEEYLAKMDEKENEMENYLKEAKGINDLSKETFEKAQSITNDNVIEFPSGPTLTMEKTAA